MSDLENNINPENPEFDTSEGDPIPVKVRENVMASIRRAAEDAKLEAEIAAEEESMLRDAKRSSRLGIPSKPKNSGLARMPQVPTTEDERMWAAMAHGSALLTIILALATGGIASLITVFIPLGIYMMHRNKSEFVAHHALQAFAAQVVGTIGFGVLLLTITITWVVLILISALLIFVLVGIILLPLVLLAGAIAVAATLLIPLALLVYSMIAAVQAWNGNTYSYPWIGDWVDDQIFETVTV